MRCNSWKKAILARLAACLALAAFMLVAPAGAADDPGLAAYKRGDFGAALQIWGPSAANGDPAAQYGLGVMYLNGEGVTRDHGQAAAWFRKAADREHPEAQVKLGGMHVLGLGMPVDREAAFDWFLRAAIRGNAQARLHVGEAYFYGRGVREDRVEAMRWFRAAAAQGDVLGQHILGTLYEGEDDVAAAEWHAKAARRGYAPAQLSLAEAFLHGRGVPRDLVRAYMWCDLAAAHGEAGAVECRERIARNLSPAQISEAKGRARYWRSMR